MKYCILRMIYCKIKTYYNFIRNDRNYQIEQEKDKGSIRFYLTLPPLNLK